ncbi:hypothetical protein [Thalassolituus pacificus]|uniref:DUF4468 domain-containing protein n=1 Tax=Thalassolituus pacificus TaxID=2975440 RepID=A0A9X2WBU1_9GAMM|nr:hypothetical protein [Thalassolituus pacificus]MCT7357609.1 hypothetical protein [Thalassolituus pacificus]
MKKILRLSVIALLLFASGCSTQPSSRSTLLFQFDQTTMQSYAWQKLLNTYGTSVLQSRVTEIYYPGQVAKGTKKEDNLDRILFVFIHPYDLKISITDQYSVNLSYNYVTFTVALDRYGKVLNHTMSPERKTYLNTKTYDSIPEFLKEIDEVRMAFKVAQQEESGQQTPKE